jgi:hypothetical protein
MPCNTILVSMRNTTITMEEEVARWARVEAAKRDMSLARFVGEMLKAQMVQSQSYERAMREFLAAQPTGHSGGEPYPKREAIHDRSAFRR